MPRFPLLCNSLVSDGMRTKVIVVIGVCLMAVFVSLQGKAQRFLTEYDSTLFLKDTVPSVVKRLENLHFSGYIQPQFQVAQARGALSYEGGNFSDSAASRFLLRRARIRVDYLLPAKGKEFPLALFAFQVDVTERGAFARDIFLRLFEPKGQNFSLTMGLFARPFGYEINLSSAARESPERGRMSQILMPAERDIGAMFTYETKKGDEKKPLFKVDAGMFNGPGLSSTTDFDSYKDMIGRLALKPYKVGRRFSVSAGLSLLAGGWMQTTRYRLTTVAAGNSKTFVLDSSLSNLGARAPRKYYGADLQVVREHGWGKTELRGEYWRGTQPGTFASTNNPGTLPMGPTYLRKFDGAFLYLLQNIANSRWEAVVKYDWYDPNTKVKGAEVNANAFSEADVKFSTLGFGLTYYFNNNLKVLGYYNIVQNEKTAVTEYVKDVEDNNFTFRMQLRF